MGSGRLAQWQGQRVDNKKFRLENEAHVQDIVKSLEGASWVIGEVEKKERRRYPTPPFVTSKLQQEAARKLGRPIVFIQANIHAGEVEGKEASLILARRLTQGDLRPLLKQLVVLITPIYNIDGNEKLSVQNRTAQNGPVAASEEISFPGDGSEREVRVPPLPRSQYAVVRALGSGAIDHEGRSVPFLVLELVEGRSLRSLLAEIEAREFRVFDGRVSVPTRRKIGIALGCWARARLPRWSAA